MRIRIAETSRTVALAALVALLAWPQAAAAQPKPGVPATSAVPRVPRAASVERAARAESAAAEEQSRVDEMYEEAREDLEEGRYERAIERFDSLLPLKSARTDAALYWKAYSQSKLGNRPGAIETLATMLKEYPNSRWIKDAKALEVEVRQASGQTVPVAGQDDDELKLLALRGIVQSDPEQALPVIEKILTSASSPNVKDRALFVLSQSRSPRAREIIVSVAKGNANPELQLRAIRYIGIMGGDESRQLLADVYRSSTDAEVKRNVLRSFGTSGDSARLIEIARTEKDPDLQRSAIRYLGIINRSEASSALLSIYSSDAPLESKKAVISALFAQNNAGALVTLARAETNRELKREIVSKLSNMKEKAATDYMLELLR